MHQILDSERNSACKDIINALEECRDRGFLYNAVGGCSNLKAELTLCLRAQRLERQRRNGAEAKERRARLDAVIAENSKHR